MIAMLTGKIIVVDVHNNTVIIDVRGIGYLLHVTEVDLEELLDLEQTSLYVVTVYKENETTLYGFISLDERRMFRKLIAVKGVGPATALAILSAMDYDELAEILTAENIDKLTSVNGIGETTAKNIVSKLGQK